MKIAVIGLWHLGLVTAGCLCHIKHQVIAYDSNVELINQLQNGRLPIQEPGLDDLLLSATKSNSLIYTHQSHDLSDCDIIWINYDTPVNDDDEADVNFIINEFNLIADQLPNNALVLISSQVPVGTTRSLQQGFAKHYPHKNVHFGYIPENLRLGKAINVFMHPDRFVVGLENENDKIKIQALFAGITEQFVWMSIESAEMTKHALNAFLALSVTYINEIASLCAQVGANAQEVEQGLKSEERIGKKAYLRAGNAIAGGTLLRDVNYLNQIGHQHAHPLPLISAIHASNVYHKQWVHRKITEKLISLQNKTIAVLGLTYKANTNTLRRSSAIETCHWLHQQGAKVNAFDPAISLLPEQDAQCIHLKSSIQETLHNAEAVIIATEWPEFCKLQINDFINQQPSLLVIDPNGFLNATFSNHSRIQYCSVGNSL